MSRLLPLLRHPPAVTTAAAALAPTTIASSARCTERDTPRRRYRHRRVTTQKQCNGDDTRVRVAPARPPVKEWEDIFISSLVAAGTCRKHRVASRASAHRPIRHYSTARDEPEQKRLAASGDAQISKEEYRNLVDFYRQWGPDTAESEDNRSPLASRLILTPEQELAAAQRQTTPGKRHVAPPEGHEQKNIVERLDNKIMLSRLGHISLDVLWNLYQQVHSPRPRFLKDWVLHRFLQHLGFVQQWHDKDAMQRYFQVLDDCVEEGVPLNKNNWTTAISFAGRWVQRTTSSEVKAAIETWMRMEEQGHAADHVTLNVLFDVAVKAGRFTLADTIYKEIKARDLPLDRYFRGSLIYYGGMKRDGDEVRRAFREFVEAGEIVDTTIMNSVILSLLRSGEAPAAEQVFNKMKRLTEEKFGTPSSGEWQERKELRSELNVAAQRLRAESEVHGSSFFGASSSSYERREQVQKITPIAPDARTYTILFKYHSTISGDADRIWELLEEMGEQGLQPETGSFVHILKGFRLHGGYALSRWQNRRLEEFWKVVIKQMELELHGTRIAPPGGANKNAVPESAPPKSTSDPPAVAEGVPSLESDSDDWVAHDGSEYGDAGHDEASPYSLDSASSDNASHSTSPSSSPAMTDDIDILGAMIAESAASIRCHDPPITTAPKQTEEAQSSSRANSHPTSFLESVSLRHLTDAALLPEGGSALEDNGHATSIKPVDNESHPSDAASSFLDSLTPENSVRTKKLGVSENRANTSLDTTGTRKLVHKDRNHDQTGGGANSGLSRYTPASPSHLVHDPDNFDSFPVWRRGPGVLQQYDHDLIPSSGRSKDSASPRAHTARPRPSLPPNQKPVSLRSEIFLEAVRAFYQCAGHMRMIQVWEGIASRWYDATDEEWARVENEVAQIERHARRYEDFNRASR
ncbi:hypothetical protein CB0940_05117 [Cercospora beticola]|uniref:Pentatricopeptide repeat-containing protein n=1 Tax=Cercospora beticola TaxID=122368 RepID=A0A2G5HLG8_CERBT|nr:hypothetical protein CB0940_05117 [Cercospora beticola]PIA93073.1 hypothetical protein CB0940_05117 [Cercospora beticola]WPB02423.1 hypothetical protein RHO25_007057 [Cercospora beticola]CAK1362687.1 unnamed protein product [Cercospora beticola]